MLYVVMRDGAEIRWHVGERFPVLSSSFIDEFVKFVQADGDELDYLRNADLYFTMRLRLSSAVFFGDHAKFIVANVLRAYGC